MVRQEKLEGVVLYPRLPLARLIGSDIAHAVPLSR